MFDKVKNFDAVMVATPDHMHAPVALMAMRMGKHVYVEKPMAHSIEEARLMAKVAKEQGIVSQMGNNGHGGEGLRLTKEWIDAGAIGTVEEIHCWSDRPGKWWEQDKERPAETPPVREGLNWNLWLGMAPHRPYHPMYCPSQWRGWFDFGTGAMGDMAIHNMDPAFYALDLDAPYAVEAETSQPLKSESFPSWQKIKYFFQAKGKRPAVTITWYDGGKQPPNPEGFEAGRQLDDNGIYFVGPLRIPDQEVPTQVHGRSTGQHPRPRQVARSMAWRHGEPRDFPCRRRNHDGRGLSGHDGLETRRRQGRQCARSADQSGRQSHLCQSNRFKLEASVRKREGLQDRA
jgi:hypothetical protein